jgi:protein gp37
MSDLFHEDVPDHFIDSVFATMRQARWHQFQVLTKRPERMAHYAAGRGDLARSHPNVWLGTSVEMQLYIKRAAAIAGLFTPVRFLSCEPLLGPLDLRSVLGAERINWVIVGGESGHGARRMDPAWVRDIRDQCRESAVAFFFKQWGGVRKKAAGRILDRRTWDQMPVTSAS